MVYVIRGRRVSGDHFIRGCMWWDIVTFKPTLPFDSEKASRLYTEGLSDREIGKIIQCGFKKVYLWRHENNLPANHHGKHKRSKEEMIYAGVITATLAVAGYELYKKYKNKKGDDK
jgi:hypothetical protein